jgi:hypothetical protein
MDAGVRKRLTRADATKQAFAAREFHVYFKCCHGLALSSAILGPFIGERHRIDGFDHRGDFHGRANR